MLFDHPGARGGDDDLHGALSLALGHGEVDQDAQAALGAREPRALHLTRRAAVTSARARLQSVAQLQALWQRRRHLRYPGQGDVIAVFRTRRDLEQAHAAAPEAGDGLDPEARTSLIA